MAIASFWSLFQIFGNYGLRLASNLIMTRLLVPEAFGLMALLGTLLTAFALFTDMGINRSIVREPDGDTDRFLRVAWVAKILRGAIIAAFTLIAALLIWLLAPSIATPGTAYADPVLPALVAVAALSPLIQGAEATTKDLTLRRLQNWWVTFVGISAQVAGLISMILFVQIEASVWALLFGMLVSTFLATALSFFIYPGPKMRFEWDAEIAWRLWTYGKFLLGSSALTFVARNADKLMLAGFLGSATFGVYTIAMVWVEAGVSLLNRIADRVGFPALAEIIRDRPHDVRRLFRKFQTVIDLFCALGFLATFLFGEALIRFLYTSDYAAAGSYLQILSLGFLVARFQTLNGLLMNIGDSRSIMIVSGIRAIAICITLPVSFHLLGLPGALLATSMTPAISAPFTIWKLWPVLGGRQLSVDTSIWAGTLGLSILVYAFSTA